MLSILARTPAMTADHHNFYHGRLKHYPPQSDPRVTQERREPGRGSVSPWLSQSEYQDRAGVLQDKLHYLARLLSVSRRTVLLTGSGLRTSSRPGTVDTASWPSPAHSDLASLVERRLISSWVTLCPDGLAQKAGCSQEFLLEVHGSWYDPANPVVRGKGRLRGDLYSRLLREGEEADLVVVLGAQVTAGTVTEVLLQSAVQRSLAGLSLGCVLISPRQTELDGEATLRVFSSAQVVTRLLLQALSLPPSPGLPAGLQCGPAHSGRVRYDREGLRSSTKTTVLNLSPGQRVRLSPGHNCQGSAQIKLRHILRPEPELEKTGRVLSAVQRQRRVEGQGRVVRFSPLQAAWELEVEGVKMLLGTWWMNAAINCSVDFLPIVNIDAKEESVGPE